MKIRLIAVILSAQVFLLSACTLSNDRRVSTSPSPSPYSTPSDVTISPEPTASPQPVASPVPVESETPTPNQGRADKGLILPVVDKTKLDKTELSWYYIPKTDGTPSGGPSEALEYLDKYYVYYLGDTSKKELYLTFDQGYENGYTDSILDTLKKHNVKAAFFSVGPYIIGNKDLVKRMVDEGHMVVNHSVNHPSMPKVTDKDKFTEEILGVERAFEELTNQKMKKYFRPPMGTYSELSLYRTVELGYKSIFWSIAYHDWDVNNQPDPEYAKNLILERTHNGAIILLHSISKTNAEILDDLITEWKARGYEFKSMDDLP
jgi:peptidoglycan-N-acetylmuramic acid deacetylase